MNKEIIDMLNKQKELYIEYEDIYENDICPDVFNHLEKISILENKIISELIKEHNKMHILCKDLIDQIEMINYEDEIGHNLNMNISYLALKEAIAKNDN